MSSDERDGACDKPLASPSSHAMLLIPSHHTLASPISSTPTTETTPARRKDSMELGPIVDDGASLARLSPHSAAAPEAPPLHLSIQEDDEMPTSGEPERAASSKPMLRSKEGWRDVCVQDSMPEAYRTVAVPIGPSTCWQHLKAYIGPGLIISVGYMDPGNWATDLAAGAQFGYRLLFVILLSNLFAILLQYLSLKLGVATGRDLAQACRDSNHRYVNYGLWVLAEVAIAATDLAEVVGCAIALELLLGIPKWAGVLITAADVLLLLALQNRNFRVLELLVGVLVLFVGVVFAYELGVSKPDAAGVFMGYLPSSSLLTNPDMLFLAIGILGATVMPHNLYLHSSLVQTRSYEPSTEARKTAIRFATIDSTISLLFAFFINSAILMLSAAAFHGTQNENVADISDAYELLSPAVGAKAASTLFALGLLASGQNSTITGTMAGQIVMEGFLQLRMPSWLRRVVTRLSVVVPAAIVAAVNQESFTALLVLSQVILSLQLSFAVIPLVWFTSQRSKMGEFVNSIPTRIVAGLVSIIIAGLNIYLVISWIMGS